MWLGSAPEEDPFGKAIFSQGVPKGVFQMWLKNPRVKVTMKNGEIKEGPSFDLTEDMDSENVIWLLTRTG